MEKDLLEILKLADLLNERQNKVYAQITYYADDKKTLEIAIRSKEDFKFIEKCEIQLKNNPIIKCNNLVDLFRNYISKC